MLLLAALLLPLDAGAQSLQELQQREQRWSLSLDTLREQIDKDELSRNQQEEIRTRLEQIIKQAQDIDSLLKERLTPVRAQLEALGPAPGEGEPEEDAETAQQRENLNRQLSEYQGLLQRSDALVARAQAQLRDLSVKTQRQRTQRLLEQAPLPLAPSTLTAAFGQLGTIWKNLNALLTSWWSEERPAERGWTPYLIVLGVMVITISLSRFVRRQTERRFGQRDDIAAPSYPRAVLAFVVTGLGRAVSPSLIAFVIWWTLGRVELITKEIEAITLGLLWAVVIYALIGQLSRAALAPGRPQWSIVPLDSAQTTGAGISMHGLAIIMAVIGGLSRAGQAIRDPLPEFVSLATFVGTATLVTFVAPLLGAWLWRPPKRDVEGSAEGGKAEGGKAEAQERETLGVGLGFLRIAIIGLLVAVVLAAFLGYSHLAVAMMDGLLATAITIGFGLILRTVAIEILQTLFSPDRRSFIARQLDLSQGGSESLVFWLTLLIDTCLILMAIPLIMLEWGVPDSVLAYWFLQISDGIKIGEFTFAPLSILYAFVVFVVGLIAVRFIKRMLNQRILSRTRLDVGARHSISAATGYVGFAVAAMLAVATLGIDLSNLAIIAGALSVGIGFGLQNVVNNFVSGLLLLIERPIKVGDWIVVSGYEGTVKRISVRSTEIETFDRSEVIVPNSELVSSPVTNWTHKTRICRVIVPVGVAYGSDTELVRDILMKVAKDHEDVLSYPAPFVIFKAFGDSSLNFELRVYARDTDYYLTLINDLHFAIDKAFREQKVEIPFPQRDLHLRDSDTLAEVLRNGRSQKVSRRQEEGKGEGEGENGETKPDSTAKPKSMPEQESDGE
ncbi:MAG: mechanosensitive ion channel [Limibacillus sp.]